MQTFRHIVLLTAFLLGPILLPAQEKNDPRSITEDIPDYPDSYSFSQAEFLCQYSYYVKALWYYINLYSQFPDKALAGIRKIGTRIANVKGHIKLAFSKYIQHDPDVNVSTRGQPTIDQEMLDQKAKWRDRILRALESE